MTAILVPRCCVAFVGCACPAGVCAQSRTPRSTTALTVTTPATIRTILFTVLDSSLGLAGRRGPVRAWAMQPAMDVENDPPNSPGIGALVSNRPCPPGQGEPLGPARSCIALFQATLLYSPPCPGL